MPAALPNDEELIPRSLMACVDAQADADPDQTPNFKNAHPRHRQPFQTNFPAFPQQLQLSSQTPYGPHVPQQPHQPLAQQNQHLPEEISTIFVVGFPEDMQEREFQNMFTFSAGFEAATLKIPNKDFPPYQPPPPLNGIRPPFPQHYPVPDPYAMMVPPVPEQARDGMWPPDQDIGAMTLGFPPHPHAAPLPQRKQIIGFAKFRSREEALAARDVLQGKRVDIEKGAVLKAEMAKKNLHTKRGVGPVALSTTFPPIPQPSAQHQNGIHDPKEHHWHHQGSDSTSTNPEEEKMALVMNFGLGNLSLNGAAGGPRGPRERAEEEDRERRRRVEETAAKEINLMRLRASNAAAFDAFHSVPAGPTNMSRQNSSGFGSNGNSASRDSPSTSFAEAHNDHQDIVGPWDRINHTTNIPIPHTRPRSTSQDSSSPFSVHAPPQQPSYENNIHHAYQPYRTHSESSQTSGSLDSANGLAPIGGGLYNQALPPSSNGGDTLVMGPARVSANNETPLGVTTLASGQQTPNVPPHPGSAGGTGNTSPTLPSPAGSSNGSNGTTNGDRPVNGGPRGTIDQNPPINTLYIGNLPTSPPPPGYQQDSLEEHLREAFQQRPGFRKLCFRHKPNGPMCFVEFSDVQFATKAMHDMSGNTLRGLVKNGIRLSYSKNPLGVRTPTSAGANNGMQQQQQIAANNSQFHQFHPIQHHDSFQTRLADEFPRVVPPTILRRENSGLSPVIQGPSQTIVPPPPPPPPSTMHNGGGGFMSSPPPRFFSTSPGGPNVIGSTPLTGASNAFIPRGMMMMGGGNGVSSATGLDAYGSVNATASGLPVPEGGNSNGASSSS